ncbi:dTDP-4-amino-4,6-dideoxygalactose transaminase [Pseudobutyrivibrio xylanivorans]|uniref:dTDP-4-amino-4,6-dideoxygalactose transaminase n=1 Tax=Pseudobutyrivibrio xylanivorans DSM 14809 TaxID=1123012 RepID=A0A1M6JR38_PSEXY|nr:dTDP-4-amino-4,6-dideoxygalactose transaminase [Pseudobutyrivibrio xylanivorans]SHJ49171.1 dTDP-4-amino-4,6-dideoxygalactose transaminase [Pseudobutyrivibrio xylanivorans DSM 14809]
MISFNVPPVIGTEEKYIKDAISKHKICGDGEYTKKCNAWFEENTGSPKVLLTTSCTHATEMAALLCDIQPGDEVIMPSFTFVSTADAFVLRGAKVVFVDIRPDTMNIDENKIEAAITDKTKAIVPVHYAGVSCEMDKIMDIARRHNLWVVEDAAQGVMSKYNGKPLGTIGDFGCYSFHETKNYSMGEGGALLIKNEDLIEQAEIIREKGTNRAKFFRGQIDKYTWVDAGSSYLPSELNAAYLYGQLEQADKIFDDRMNSWNEYYDGLKELADAGKIELPVIPEGCEHNAHMFYLKCKDLEERTNLINYAKDNGVQMVFHYIPLHSAPAGKKYGRFDGEDIYTTKESERLVRLPLYYGLSKEDRTKVIETVKSFYKTK